MTTYYDNMIIYTYNHMIIERRELLPLSSFFRLAKTLAKTNSTATPLLRTAMAQNLSACSRGTIKILACYSYHYDIATYCNILQHIATFHDIGCIGCGYVWITMVFSQRGCIEVLVTMRLMESLKSQMLYSHSSL